MYWIYLLIFILAILVPKLIGRDFLFLAEEDMETIAIFLLGSTGFFLYLWKEKQVQDHVTDKARLEKEATKISRDLMDSYSYIGAINRKLDILKNIALGLPEKSAFTPEKQKEVYDSIVEAISVLGKTDVFILRFVHFESGRVEKEIQIGKPSFGHVDCRALAGDEKAFHTLGRCHVIRSPKSLGSYGAFIILDSRDGASEDAEILKALASQALFLFVLEKGKETGDIHAILKA
jgi:hypothetical protein